jgi:hypothetical protein
MNQLAKYDIKAGGKESGCYRIVIRKEQPSVRRGKNEPMMRVVICIRNASLLYGQDADHVLPTQPMISAGVE